MVHCPQQKFAELKPFLEFMIARGCKSVLEIGSASGGLTYIFANLFDRVVAVDVRHQASYVLPNILRLVIDPGFPAEVIHQLRGHRFDLLFIDGDHSKPGLLSDLDLYEPFLAKSGVLALHDIKDTGVQRNTGCQVSEVVQDGFLSKRYKETRIYNEFVGEWGGNLMPEAVNYGGIQVWFDRRRMK
jgi:predicted O-methyltransferase YrrM